MSSSLSASALEVLDIVVPLRLADDDGSAFVFHGQKRARPLSVMAMTMVMRRLNVDATVHGFRSAFRDGAAEETVHLWAVAEQALAHVVGDATGRAYRRGGALEKRRVLMADWGRSARQVEVGGEMLPVRLVAGLHDTPSAMIEKHCSTYIVLSASI